jgi:ATP-dependent DNA helicase RecG
MMGRINLENLKPHPKNPTIANFFKQIGWVEELGSGVRKMYKYCPIYVNGALPVIEEGDVFKITIKYELGELVNDGVIGPINKPVDGALRTNDLINEPINNRVNEPLSEYEVSIISLLKVTPGMNREEISRSINRGRTSIYRYITSLKDKNLIEYRGSRKTRGYYIITEKKEEK